MTTAPMYKQSEFITDFRFRKRLSEKIFYNFDEFYKKTSNVLKLWIVYNLTWTYDY